MFTVENTNDFMNGLCGSPFWDANLTWYTENPDFTVCFKKSVLVWIPCTFLWTCLPFEIHKLRNSKTRDIPLTLFNINKLTASIILLMLSLTNVIRNVIIETITVPVDIYSPITQFFTFALFLSLTWANLKMGVRSSGILFVFTLLLVICGAPEFRSEIMQMQSSTTFGDEKLQFISSTVYYGAVLLLFFLNCFVDSKPRYSLCYDDQVQNECPEKQASFPSRLFFCWFDSFVWKAYKKPLRDEDFWSLDHEYTSATVVPQFEKRWNASFNKVKKSPAVKVTITSKEYYDDTYQVEYRKTNEKSKRSFLIPVFKLHLVSYAVVIFYLLIENIFIFISPQLLNLLITFINGGEPAWKGYMYSVLFLLTALSQSLILAYYHTKLQIVQMLVRSTLVNVVYKKTLTISCKARKSFTTGEIVNLMSSDIRKFTQIIWNFNVLWSAPFQIVGVFYFLWKILGPSAFSGIILLVAFVPLNSYLSSNLKNLQRIRLKCKDKRVKMMNEILSGIKVLKLYAWEPSFEKQVQHIRNKELRALRKQIGLNITLILLWNIMPYLISLATFATYVLSSDDHVLDAQKIFVSVSLFNILKNPLTALPQVVSEMMQTAVSVTRINKFLNAEELDPDAISHENRVEALFVENGSFSWIDSDGPPVLRNINLRINEGCLVAVVGPVGAGKSSLLSAFLGETYKLSGKVNTKGSIAYVPQLAWIRNTTLRENITLGNPVEESFYKKILESCALKPDLKILPGGDLTEIGEKGINLSGGQKQRVSLARALCSNADIYFLDDPLSAVDAHVGNHIFQNVIGPNGMLGKKTRIMVTHSATFLSETDLIIVLKNGTISEIGTFPQLLNNDGDFAEFLRNYSSEEVIESASNGADEKKIKPTNSLKTKKKDESTSSGVMIRNETTSKKLIKKEHVETGYVKGKVYKHFLISAGIFFPLATLLMFFALQSTIVSANFWLSKWSIDKNASSDGVQNIEKRNYYLKYYALFGLLQAIFTVCGNCTLFIGFLKASTNIHERLLSKVLKWPIRRFDVTPIGRILNRFGYDIDVVDYTLAMKISKLLLKAGMIISTLFIVSYTTPPFIYVCIVLLVLFRMMQKFYLATSQQIRRMESNSRSPIYSHFAETVTGLESIRAYGLPEKFVSLSQEKVDFNQARVYASVVAARWSALRLEAIANSVVFFASLFSVIYRNQLDAGLVGVSVSYSLQITKGFSWLMRTFTEIETLMVSIERVREYEEYRSEAAWEILPKRIPQDWPSVGEIRFVDYKLRYDDDLNLVLKGLTMTINGGEKVGVVGRTGAGKSSLALGLFRILEPASGSILIDGVDVSTLGLHDLRSRLTIIPQDPVLFSGTLRINLDPFENHTDEALWNALEHANLKKYFSSMPKGLQYDIDEGGFNLSVGQRQLICLARALLRKTKILILDEATAAIDLETDELIQATIRHEFCDNTVLTIAHRLNTIMDYDRILVLNDGRVTEYDTPQVLLRQKTSTFYEMAYEAGLI